MMHSPMRLKISQWLWHSFPICVISSSASPQENRVPTGRFRKSYPSTIRFSPKAPSGISAPFARKASIFHTTKGSPGGASARRVHRPRCPSLPPASPFPPRALPFPVFTDTDSYDFSHFFCFLFFLNRRHFIRRCRTSGGALSYSSAAQSSVPSAF